MQLSTKSTEDYVGAFLGILITIAVLMTPFVIGEHHSYSGAADVIQVRNNGLRMEVDVRWASGEVETLENGGSLTWPKIEDSVVENLVPGAVYRFTVYGFRLSPVFNRGIGRIDLIE